MDIVRDNIELIGGAISLTTAGKGTRFSLKIPLTLAIAPALIVELAVIASPCRNIRSSRLSVIGEAGAHSSKTSKAASCCGCAKTSYRS